jgi:hypothetical protein
VVPLRRGGLRCQAGICPSAHQRTSAIQPGSGFQGIKLSVTLRRRERSFWQARSYDFNVWTGKKRVEKLRYMHRNPVVRGLVEKPSDWPWSSFRHYVTGFKGSVENRILLDRLAA